MKTARHVLIGGSGFTGRHFCDALIARGERPFVIDLIAPHPRFEGKVDFRAGDVSVPEGLPSLQPEDVVYHLAARQFAGAVPYRGRNAWFADVNVRGTERVLDAMTAAGAHKLIFFSTDMTYGKPDHSPVLASHQQRPIGPYGRSKVLAERAVVHRMATGVVDATVFRPRLIAGRGRLGVLTKLFALVHRGLPVPMIGAGHNRYQMIAVEDCVEAALRAVELGCPAGPFNLGSENPPRVCDLLRQLCQRAGSGSLLIPTPAGPMKSVLALLDLIGMPLLYPEQFAIADADYVLDTSHTRVVLEWTPNYRDTDILFAAYEDFLMTS